MVDDFYELNENHQLNTTTFLISSMGILKTNIFNKHIYNCNICNIKQYKTHERFLFEVTSLAQIYTFHNNIRI